MKTEAEVRDALAVSLETRSTEAFAQGWDACLRESPTVKQMRKALEFYANTNSWGYTSYDNYHQLHDDARTVKLPGGIADVSGDRAEKALQAYAEVTK